MAIKHLTFSFLTGGALMLAYAAWSKWRPVPPLAPLKPTPKLASAPVVGTGAAALEAWDSPEPTPNPQEELVDFTVELGLEDDDGPVALEDLGVRWLARATEAMSPFAQGLSVYGETDAALNARALEAAEEAEAQPESQRMPEEDIELDFDFPISKPA